jgi:hypothetical protein
MAGKGFRKRLDLALLQREAKSSFFDLMSLDRQGNDNIHAGKPSGSPVSLIAFSQIGNTIITLILVQMV